MIIPVILVFAWLNVAWIYWYEIRPTLVPGVAESTRNWFLNFTGLLLIFGGAMWGFMLLDMMLLAIPFAPLSLAAWIGAWETGNRYRKLQRKAYRAQQQDAE